MFLDNSVVANGIASEWGVSAFQDGSWSATAGLAPAEACLETSERRHRPHFPRFCWPLEAASKIRRNKWVGLVLVSKHRSTGASPVVTKSNSLGVYQKRGGSESRRST